MDFKRLAEKARKTAEDARRTAENFLASEANGCFDPDRDPSTKDVLKALAAAPLIALPLLAPGVIGTTAAVLIETFKVDEDKAAETAAKLYRKLDKDILRKVGGILGSLPAEDLHAMLKRLPGHMDEKVSPETIKMLLSEIKQITQSPDDSNGPESKPDVPQQEAGNAPTPPPPSPGV